MISERLSFRLARPTPPNSFVNSSTASTVAGLSVAAGPPSGSQSGDLLVATIVGEAGVAVAPPAGWTVRATEGPGSLTVLTATYNGTDLLFTFTVLSAVNLGLVISSYRGFSFGSIGAVSVSAQHPTPPSLLVSTEGSIALIVGGAATAGSTYAMPSNWSARGSLSVGRSVLMFERNTLAPAEVLTGTQVQRNSGTAVDCRVYLMSLRPN
jgi:hypothetical protein